MKVASGASVLVFCIYDLGLGSDALISFLGGGATLPSGAFTVVSTPAMNISVTSTTENWYSVRDSSGAGWLSSSTLTSATAPAVLTLRATTTGLAAGTYTATVTVTRR